MHKSVCDLWVIENIFRSTQILKFTVTSWKIITYTGYIMFSFESHKCALDACYMPAFDLKLSQWNCARFPQLWPGCLLALPSLQPLLVTLSKQIKGHMIRRGRTLGPIQQPGPIVYNTWAPRNTEKDGKKGNKEEFRPQCVSRQAKRRESFVKVFS